MERCRVFDESDIRYLLLGAGEQIIRLLFTEQEIESCVKDIYQSCEIKAEL